MKGSCLCGAVRFEVSGEVTRNSACHCTMCRKVSGHYWAAANAAPGSLKIDGPVTWYASSDIADRGFCPTCGSALFWRPSHGKHVSFALGAVDGETGLALQRHIFTADKGDYYDLTDDLPKS